MTYAAGLRLFEVAALRIADLDFECKTIFVEQGENGKSRYIPIDPRGEPPDENYISMQVLRMNTL